MNNQNKKMNKLAGTLICIIVLLFGGYELYPQTDSPSSDSAPAAHTETAEVESEHTHYTFKNQDRLDDHYEKHGAEMGFNSAKDYEEAACSVVNNPDSLHKTEKEDDDTVYYLEDTNEFVILSPSRYIRTYYEPDGGKAYYDRQ